MALTKKQEMAKLKKQNERLLKMVAEEREKVAGYEQIAKVHSAYIAILLKAIGNSVTITESEVKEALEKYEVRAFRVDDGWSLYCEVIE